MGAERGRGISGTDTVSGAGTSIRLSPSLWTWRLAGGHPDHRCHIPVSTWPNLILKLHLKRCEATHCKVSSGSPLSAVTCQQGDLARTPCPCHVAPATAHISCPLSHGGSRTEHASHGLRAALHLGPQRRTLCSGAAGCWVPSGSQRLPSDFRVPGARVPCQAWRGHTACQDGMCTHSRHFLLLEGTADAPSGFGELAFLSINCGINSDGDTVSVLTPSLGGSDSLGVD